jgi:hypothetical protein
VRLALATCRAVPQLSADDRLLLPALQAVGIDGEPVVWDDPAVRWDRFDATVIRSCWDYHLQIDRFDAWICRLEDRA